MIPSILRILSGLFHTFFILFLLSYLSCADPAQKPTDAEQKTIDSLKSAVEERERNEIRRDEIKEVVEDDLSIIDTLKLDTLGNE